MNPTLAAVVSDALNFPTELDNGFSDADVAARQAAADHIAEMNEAAQIEENVKEFVAAAQEYVDMVNKVFEAYNAAERDLDHENALREMETK